MPDPRRPRRRLRLSTSPRSRYAASTYPVRYKGRVSATRCAWVGTDDLYIRYHDTEWGRPVTDDHRPCQKICLDGLQAGLSWITILRKRPAYRAGVAGPAPINVARPADDDVDRPLADPEHGTHDR